MISNWQNWRRFLRSVRVFLTISQKKKNVEISHCRVADKGENDSRFFAEWI